MKNENDKSRHLPCIQWENWNTVVYGCRDVAIILRWPEFKKSQPTNTFHYKPTKSFLTDVCSWKQKERKDQIMKLKASGNVHFVYMTSLIFRRNWPFISLGTGIIEIFKGHQVPLNPLHKRQNILACANVIRLLLQFEKIRLTFAKKLCA